MFVPADDEASSAQALERPSDIPPGVAETLAQRLLAFEHCLSGFGVGMDQSIQEQLASFQFEAVRHHPVFYQKAGHKASEFSVIDFHHVTEPVVEAAVAADGDENAALRPLAEGGVATVQNLAGAGFGDEFVGATGGDG